MKNKIYKIYELINLETKEVFYVGITKKSLGSRRSGHIPYVKSLGISRFGIRLIEETDDATRESYWIEEYKKNGHTLFNKNGGVGSKIPNNEYIKKWLARNPDYHKEYRRKNNFKT